MILVVTVAIPNLKQNTNSLFLFRYLQLYKCLSMNISNNRQLKQMPILCETDL